MSRGISKKNVVHNFRLEHGRREDVSGSRLSRFNRSQLSTGALVDQCDYRMGSPTCTTEKPGLWGGWDPIFWHRLMPIFAESNALLRHSWKCVDKEIASIPEGPDAIFGLEEKNSSSLIPVNYLASSEATKRTLTTPHSSGAASIVKVVATSPKIGSSFSSTLESRTGVSSDVVPSLAIFTTL